MDPADGAPVEEKVVTDSFLVADHDDDDDDEDHDPKESCGIQRSPKGSCESPSPQKRSSNFLSNLFEKYHAQTFIVVFFFLIV